MPRQQQNDRSAFTLLALLDVTPDRPWADATPRLIGIHDMLEWVAEHYGVRYAENSRETFRRQTLHQFVHGAIALKNPDDPARPINSPKTVYRIAPAASEVVRSFGSASWLERVTGFVAQVETLARRYAQERDSHSIPLEIAPGISMALTAGGQNVLVKLIVEEFGPRFTRHGKVLYIGDAGAKEGYFDAGALAELGLAFDKHGQMPDVVILDRERNWLILIEAVTSHGPVNAKRLIELKELFAGSSAGLVFVTAFPDRKTFGRYLPEVAWETEVWIADDPSHMIHLNGQRFLGPY